MNAAQLSAVLAAPEDDAVRLEVAAQLERAGDPRGEFIRLQVQRAAMDRREGRAQRSVESAREDALLRRCGAAWAAEVGPWVKVEPPCRGESFHRGFVERVFVSAAVEVDLALARAPIRHVSCHKWQPEWRAFLAAWWLPRLRSLILSGTGAGDALALAVAATPGIAPIRVLGLPHNGIGRAGVEALVASPSLAHKVRVDFTGNNVDPCERPGVDEAGSVVAVDTPPILAELERTYGARTWLHYPWRYVEQEPDVWMA